MSRKPSGSPEAIKQALTTAKITHSSIELRRALAVVLPVLHGLSLKETANLVGRSEAWVARERLDFIQNKPQQAVEAPKGGRKNQLMPAEEEDAFMEMVCRRYIKGRTEWRLGVNKSLSTLREAEKSFVQLVQDALEEKIQRKTTRTTVYNLMARTGKRRFADYKPDAWRMACERDLPGAISTSEKIPKYLAHRYGLGILKRPRKK